MSNGAVAKSKKLLGNKDVKSRYAMLRSISGPTRYRILVLLSSKPSGMTVSDLSEVLGASLSRISHQMRILKKKSLVSGERSSRTITYSITDQRIRKYLVA